MSVCRRLGPLDRIPSFTRIGNTVYSGRQSDPPVSTGGFLLQGKPTLPTLASRERKRAEKTNRRRRIYSGLDPPVCAGVFLKDG
jgi:hypothetical protein